MPQEIPCTRCGQEFGFRGFGEAEPGTPLVYACPHCGEEYSQLRPGAHSSPHEIDMPGTIHKLAEAAVHDDIWVIMVADFGGVIMLTFPARRARCSEEALEELCLALSDIDGGSRRDSGIFYDRAQVGSWVSGGVGGGVITPGLWLHAEMGGANVASLVFQILMGQKPVDALAHPVTRYTKWS